MNDANHSHHSVEGKLNEWSYKWHCASFSLLLLLLLLRLWVSDLDKFSLRTGIAFCVFWDLWRPLISKLERGVIRQIFQTCKQKVEAIPLWMEKGNRKERLAACLCIWDSLWPKGNDGWWYTVCLKERNISAQFMTFLLGFYVILAAKYQAVR